MSDILMIYWKGPESVPTDATPVETAADKEPPVEAPEEEVVLGKDAGKYCKEFMLYFWNVAEENI